MKVLIRRLGDTKGGTSTGENEETERESFWNEILFNGKITLFRVCRSLNIDVCYESLRDFGRLSMSSLELRLDESQLGTLLTSDRLWT